ncbi:hypothetical protein [Variovorax sp. LjRoot178]|uniref:hypothetical protein n=1 Tax=Variovorax sp. LjRoot178 TaxID=3342277 RepID=UPI003ECF9BEB
MDEQIFLGDEPTNEAGKEIRFPNVKVWVALHACITSRVYPDLPFLPLIAARDAEVLATAINGALEDGSCTKFFEEHVLIGALGSPKDDVVLAPTYEDWIKRFAAFLEGCGGCRPG